MKKLVSLFVVAGLLFVACNNNKPAEPEEVTEPEVVEEVVEEQPEEVVEEAPAEEPAKAPVAKKAAKKKAVDVTVANKENAKKVEVNTNNKSIATVQQSKNAEVASSNAKTVEVKTKNVTTNVTITPTTSETPTAKEATATEVSVKSGKTYNIKK